MRRAYRTERGKFVKELFNIFRRRSDSLRPWANRGWRLNLSWWVRDWRHRRTAQTPARKSRHSLPISKWSAPCTTASSYVAKTWSISNTTCGASVWLRDSMDTWRCLKGGRKNGGLSQGPYSSFVRYAAEHRSRLCNGTWPASPWDERPGRQHGRSAARVGCWLPEDRGRQGLMDLCGVFYPAASGVERTPSASASASASSARR